MQGTHTNGSVLQNSSTRDQIYGTAVQTSPHINSLSREPSWPVEGFGDLHLSGSEPRIFPGIVSRTQRRDSLVRKNSASETDDHGSITSRNRGKSRSKTSYDGLEEADEESDEDVEEGNEFAD